MAIITKAIKLETTKQNLVQAIIAKQGDCNSRFLNVTFLDEGAVIPLDSSSSVTINAEREDGASQSFFGVVNNDDTVTVPLHSWVLELAGVANCDISIITDGSKLTTTTFVVKVEKAACSSESISTDPQYDVLANLIDDVSGAKQITSQGRSAKYNFTTPGWKRILNIIRTTNGAIDIGLASGKPYRMVQALAFDVSGFVKYPTDTTDSKPTIIKRYENTFGNDDAVNDHPFKVTAVRIGYPKVGTTFPETDGVTDYTVNPVNCYVDIYVDTGFDGWEELTVCNEYHCDMYMGVNKEYIVESIEGGEDDLSSYTTLNFGGEHYLRVYDGTVDVGVGDSIKYDGTNVYHKVAADHDYLAFNMNYAGFADSHNCEAITEETNATDVGIYGEELTYYEVDVDSMPYFVQSTEMTGYVSMNQVYSGSASGYGVRMHNNGFLCIDQATESEIDKGTNKYKAITAYNVKYAVEKVLQEHGLI